MKNNPELADLVTEEIGWFVFFLLGSDAKIEVDQQVEGIKVSIAHRRITPMVFELSWNEVSDMLQKKDRLENFLLDLLNEHRRS